MKNKKIRLSGEEEIALSDYFSGLKKRYDEERQNEKRALRRMESRPWKLGTLGGLENTVI